MAEPTASAPDAMVAHLTECRKVDAAIVIDGNGDDVVATLLAAGWTYSGEEHVAGKRVRYLVPPAELEPHLSPDDDGEGTTPVRRASRTIPDIPTVPSTPSLEGNPS
jgi:hypothetical protein